MTESEVLDLKLSGHLLRLMLDEKIPFERKKGKMDYLVRIGADVNKKVYGKSMALWVKELGDENLIKYVKERGGVEHQISKEKRDEFGCQFWDKNGEIKSVDDIKDLVLMGANLGVYEYKYGRIWDDLGLEDMNEILKDLPRGYVIDGDVRLSHRCLTELPDFSKIKVGGGFDCSSNRLTDLKGAPEKVGGSFDCQKNQLTDLKGAPEKVGESFDCSENQLTDLKGAPEKVGGDFWCYNNKLTDLKGAPEKIGGGFDCRYNQLTTLEGMPEYIRGKFYIEKEVLARIEEAEKKKKSDNAMVGFVGNKYEM